MTTPYELTNTYHARVYGFSDSGFTFDAPTPQDAWAKTRTLFMGERSSRILVSLERLALIQNPAVEFVGGQEPGVLETPLRTKHWFKVVVGCTDFGWPGEPAGGAVLCVSPNSTGQDLGGERVWQLVGPGHDPLKTLESYTKDETFIREAILEGLAKHDASPYAGTEHPVWIQFCKNKRAADNFGLRWVSTTRETWENVLNGLGA